MYNAHKFNFKTNLAQVHVGVPIQVWAGEWLFDAWKSNNDICLLAQYHQTRLLFESHKTNTSPTSNSELLLTHQTGVVSWCGHNSVRCVWCPATGCMAERVRPSGSDRLARDSVGLFGRLRPLQTSAQAGLTEAPLQPAFMCPLMRKPPAQQPAIKHRQIKTPKYESATLPNSAGQARGVALL